MADQSFPVPELWPYVQPHWPQANAAGVNEALSDYQAARKDGKEGLNVSWNGYVSLLQGLWADPSKPASDSYDVVNDRVKELKQSIEDFDAIADANEQAMTQGATNAKAAKDTISAKGQVAAALIAMAQAQSSSGNSNPALAAAAQQRIIDNLVSGTTADQQAYAGKNNSLPPVSQYQVPNPPGTDGGMFQQNQQADNQSVAIKQNQQADNQSVAIKQNQQADNQSVAIKQNQQADGVSGSGSTSSTGSQSISQAFGGDKGVAGSVGSSLADGASTGLQSAGAVVEHAAPAAASQAAPQAAAGGGVGAAPSIGGIGAGAAAGGAGQPARIGGVGGGSVGGGEGPRTGAQGAVSGEKPAASSSSSGPSQQSSLSRGGGVGAGGAGAETRAMSAQQAALRDSLRTQDAAAGAGAHAERAAAAQHVLTGSVSSLHPPSLNALTTHTQSVAGAWAALPDRVAARSPLLDAQDAQTLFAGGALTGAGRWGFGGPGGTDWLRLPLPALDGYPGAGFLLLVSEDYSVAPNPDVGVFRPVVVEVTSTEANGAVRPEFEVPGGALVMDRSTAPRESHVLADPGKLALALARWRLGLHDSHATSARPVAVGFPRDPGEGAVLGLAQLGVESYWAGRGGWALDNADAEGALVSGTEQAGAAASRAEREAQAKFDAKSAPWGVPAGARPDAPFDGAGLTGKDKASYEHYRRELGRSPTAKEYAEDRMARKRHLDGTVDESVQW